MNGTTHFLTAALAALALSFAITDPALAGMTDFFNALCRRERVIQVCAIVLAFGLFIMIKKFAPSR